MNDRYSLFRTTVLFVLSAIPALPSFGQAELVSRVVNYNDQGFVSMSPESVYPDITGVSNYSNPQTNMVRHGGLFYHVFTAVDIEGDIFLRTSPDGLVWSAPVPVNDDASQDSIQVYPNLVVYDDAGNTIVVVCWDDRRGGNSQLRTASSSDGGATFAPSVVVSTNAFAVYTTGSIAVDAAGRLYAAWSYSDGGCLGTVRMSTSDDNGASWTAPVVIFTGACFSGGHVHALAGGADTVLVFVGDDQFNHMNAIVLSSTNGGQNFAQSSVTTYTGAQTIVIYMSSAIDAAGRVHLAYIYGETQAMVMHVYHTYSDDWGATWSTAVAASDPVTLFTPTWGYDGQQVPAIAVAPQSGTIYIAWADERVADLDFNVYLSRSTDGGASWDTDLLVNDFEAAPNQGCVSLDVVELGGGNEQVILAWNDDRYVLAVAENTTAEVSVHPVPTGDLLNITLPKGALGNFTYRIVDARGSAVDQGTLQGGALRTLDVGALRPGMYVLQLVQADRVLNLTWLKQ